MLAGRLLSLAFLLAPARSQAPIDLPEVRQDAGSMDCAPAAAASSILWLRTHGFPGLWADEAPGALVEELARRMRTRERRGTFAKRFLTGVESFVRSRGLRARRLEYRGRAPHPARFGPDGVAPDAGWLRAALASKAVVWLGIGRYRRQDRGGVLRRESGHWVSLAGVDVDERGAAGAASLVIRNPAHGAPQSLETLGTEPLADGILAGKEGEPEVPAAGFSRIVSGFKTRRGQIAVVDSAVVLELTP